MEDNNLQITPLTFTRDWRKPSDFPTYQSSEVKVREDMQFLHEETREYINDTLVPGLQKLIENSPSSGGDASGAGFKVLDYYTSLEELQAAVADPEAGDAYGVGASAPYDIYVYGKTSGWVNNGQLQGASGQDGAAGKSAYEAAQEGGFTGTEAEFNTMLAQGHGGDGWVDFWPIPWSKETGLHNITATSHPLSFAGGGFIAELPEVMDFDEHHYEIEMEAYRLALVGAKMNTNVGNVYLIPAGKDLDTDDDTSDMAVLTKLYSTEGNDADTNVVTSGDWPSYQLTRVDTRMAKNQWMTEGRGYYQGVWEDDLTRTGGSSDLRVNGSLTGKYDRVAITFQVSNDNYVAETCGIKLGYRIAGDKEDA